MKFIDRRHFGPMLLMVSLAIVASAMLLMLAASSQDTVSAQECVPADNPLAGLVPICSDDDATATPTAEGNCVPADSPLAGLVPVCVTATPTPDAAATAQAIEDMTATAQAQQTAVAAAEETATALANAAATAQAQADMTATARAKRTATAAARMTRTAIAQATAAAGGSPPPAPRPTATPVHIEKVAVTMVEGATTVEPDGQATLMAGNVTVKLPTLSRARTYQAMLSESDDCGSSALACADISIYNAEGEMESDVRLISSAEIMVMLDADAVSGFGAGLDGGAVAIQANALGGFSLQLMDDMSGEWNGVPHDFMVNSDGSATVTAMTRRLSDIGLTADADAIDAARMQFSMALGTPTATPIPTATPVPPTPVPTATPVPTPEPIVIVAPDTGEGSMPFLMLLAAAAAASMLAFVGAKLIVARVRR